MKWMTLFTVLVILAGCKPSKYLQKQNVQLSKPSISVSNVFFDKEAIVNVEPSVKGVKFEYSIDDGEKKKYINPIVLSETSKVSVQAKGGAYLPSSEVSIEVVQIPKVKNNSISSERPLNEKYGRAGLDILIDVEKGKSSFQNGWLGYLGDTVDFTVDFDTREVEKIVVSTLRNHGSWIFSPEKINIYGNGKLIFTHSMNAAIEGQANSSIFTEIYFPKIKTDKLTVELIAMEEIPEWHQGAGSKPWIFVDEIFIY